MATLFTRIIQGEIPCHKIAEDDNYFAFLDSSPLATGHTLVIPKLEVDYIFRLDDATLSGLMLFAKKIAPAIQAAVPCARLGVSVIGLEVPHVHLHLIPMNKVADMNFANPKLSPTQEELSQAAAAIRSHL
jgi:histidine triad (HIT) family protein